MTKHDPKFEFDNTYARDLDGFYVPWKGEIAPTPKIVQLNRPLASELGLDADAFDSAAGAAIFAGSVSPDGAEPLAQAYAGHQFGGFSPQLGDGRALLVGEVVDKNGERRDIHLKGSGRTPFSRGGDGKAVLAPVLREYLIGEAMHGLGIRTTRALAAVTTGELIERDGPKPGAVLARIASSHLRVGTFQFFAARDDQDKVRMLADYAIARHYPDLADTDGKYLSFLSRVIAAQAALVASWMHVGFVHGVMNTDNMTISGETIDYGPCAFIDAYDPKVVFSSIDHAGRYAFGQQPVIAQWNLARLAETLLGLIDGQDHDNAIRLATNEVNSFIPRYTKVWTEGMRAKIGLASVEDADGGLINQMFASMEGQGVDYTQFFRRLADVNLGPDDGVMDLFDDPASATNWLNQWRDRLMRDPQDPADRAQAMNQVNPVYIPRNHLVEAALQAAQNDDNLVPFNALLDVLLDPFQARDGLANFANPAPDSFGDYTTYCGT